MGAFSLGRIDRRHDLVTDERARDRWLRALVALGLASESGRLDQEKDAQTGSPTEAVSDPREVAELLTSLDVDELDAVLALVCTRDLSRNSYPLVHFDVNHDVEWQSACDVLVAVTGVTGDGDFEPLDIATGAPHDEHFWHEILGRLEERGLTGVRVVGSEPIAAARRAVETHLPAAEWRTIGRLESLSPDEALRIVDEATSDETSA